MTERWTREFPTTGVGRRVDLGTRSRRWRCCLLAAGKNEASTTTAYGPSGKSLRYSYRHDSERKTVSLSVQCDPKRYKICHLLSPGKQIRRVTLNGKPAVFTLETVKTTGLW